MQFLPDESVTTGGVGRADRFSFAPRFRDIDAIAPHVLLEVGTSSGTYPAISRSMSSYVAEYLRSASVTFDAEDEAPFDMPLLHFRRTFVEKMFAIHAKVEIFKETGQPIGGYARHYYDIWCLAQQPEVITMLQAVEYADIKSDYERISLDAFPRGYRRPTDMSFANSDALFPGPSLATTLSAEYKRQCQLLCYGPYPSWDDLQVTLQQLRRLL